MEKEKQSKLRNKILKILPKAAAAITVTFQNPPFSPGRDHKLRSENGTRWVKPPHHGGKGFSGPVVSMIPHEARRKPKGETTDQTQEPTSPKISCMGQIKHKKKQISKTNNTASLNPTRAVNNSASSSIPIDIEAKKHGSKFQRMFLRSKSKSKIAARKSDAFAAVGEGNGAAAPPMGEMRRFASGRETFANFDWKAVIGPEEIDQRDCYSDEERDVEEDEILIPFSAPILGGGGGGRGGANNNVPNDLSLKPRNEINLWKRRTMAPPRPLQLNPVLTAK